MKKPPEVINIAYVPQQLPENEQNPQAPQGTTTPNPVGNLPPVQTGGSSGQSSGGTAGGGNPAAGTSTQFAPTASKLSDYLSTNAPQVAQQGQTIAGNLTQGYNQAQSDINNAVSGFGTDVQGGYYQANPDLVNKAASNPAEFAGTTGGEQIQGGPAGFTDKNVSDFQNLWNDTYTGPQNFESTTPYQNVQNEVQNAVTNAQNVQTPAGLTSYLNTQAKGNYLPGMATLDTALVQGSPQALGAIQQAAQPYQGLTDYLGTQTQGANAQVPIAQQAAKDVQGAVRNQFTGEGGVIPEFNQNIQNNLATTTDKATAYNNAINNLIKQEGEGDPAKYMQELADAVNAYNTDTGYQPSIPGAGYTHNAITVPTWNNPNPLSPPTIEQVVTPEDIANQNAYQTLLGTDYTPAFSAEGQTPYNVPIAPTLQNQVSALLDYYNSGQVGLTDETPEDALKYNTAINDLSAYLNTLGGKQLATPPPAVTPPTVPTTPPPTIPDTPPPPSGPYDANDRSTWTMDQHPANTRYNPMYGGWYTGTNYVNGPDPWTKGTWHSGQ